MVKLTVNGMEHEVDADADTPLLYVLRNDLGLDGAKFGCGLGQCGSCTVLIGDAPVMSCTVPLMLVGNRPVTTVEGLGTPDQPGPMQQAFIEEQAAQCGHCIAGMMMRAQALLLKRPDATEADIRTHMEPSLCRCGTHMRILKAVMRAADLMRIGAKQSAVKG